MLNKEQAYYLLQKLMDGQASSAERATLSQLLQQNHPQEQWIELMEELYHVQSQTEQPVYNEAEWKPVLQQLLQDVRAHNPKVIPMWKRIAIAASIVITIGIAAWFIINPERQSKGPAVVVSPDQQHDVPAPDKNRAQIKLSDGSIVYLDSAANGELVNTNGVIVTKTADGKIIYAGTSPSPVGEGRGEVLNTLTNPRGSIVLNMTLADGSKVWLNAGSSITYPVAFIGNERKVNITGEAYFEIAKHDLPPALAGGKKGVRMPFIVSANNKADVTVLGTHFNVNAYDDEQETKITLLEGSVKVSSFPGGSSLRGTKQSAFLKPGEQAILSLSKETQNLELRTFNSPDIEQVLAWKNGSFVFGEAMSVETIMREISRWYNVDVVYEKKPTGHIGGSISRSVNITKVLQILEATGTMKFKVEGRKVTLQ